MLELSLVDAHAYLLLHSPLQQALQECEVVYSKCLEHLCPRVSELLRAQRVPVGLFLQLWLLSLFCYQEIPLVLISRIWDSFLLDGFETLVRVALAVVKVSGSFALGLATCRLFAPPRPDFYPTRPLLEPLLLELPPDQILPFILDQPKKLARSAAGLPGARELTPGRHALLQAAWRLDLPLELLRGVKSCSEALQSGNSPTGL